MKKSVLTVSNLARALAVTLGAWALTVIIAVTLSLAIASFGVNRAETVMGVTLASFIVYPLIAMASFHARSPIHAWCWLGAISLPLVGLGWWLRAAL